MPKSSKRSPALTDSATPSAGSSKDKPFSNPALAESGSVKSAKQAQPKKIKNSLASPMLTHYASPSAGPSNEKRGSTPPRKGAAAQAEVLII